MLTILLDGNIYNKLQNDEQARSALVNRIDTGEVQVVATPIIVDELNSSPFGGVPDWFFVRLELDAVGVYGITRYGQAGYSEGKVFDAHRGTSKKSKDAIIAESASSIADIFVTEDDRCRKRLARLGTKCRALSWEEFREWLSGFE